MNKKPYYALVLASLLFLGMVPLTKMKDSKRKSTTITLVEEKQIDISETMKHTSQYVASVSQNNSNVQEQLNVFFNHLYNSVETEKGMTPQDVKRITDAICFSAKKHEGQTRKDADKTPYIIHPIGVADHLLYVGKVYDPDILIGALLHDTVEDTNTTFEEITAHFGPVVEGYVKEVTDDKSLPVQTRKDLQIEHAKDKSFGAAQIKLGDKFYNLRDLLQSPPPDWSKERVDTYFNWAEKVVNSLPQANDHLKKAVDDLIETHRSEIK